MYRAVLNLDFTNSSGASRTRARNQLVAALNHCNWSRVETSAYAWEGDDLGEAWRAIALVAHQAASIGTLSALTYHIQLMDEGAAQMPNIDGAWANQAILNKPAPW